MKKTYISTLIVLALFSIVFAVEGNAQSFKDLDKIPHDISYYRESRVTPPLVKVLYGRPSKNNQDVFGNLVPYNQIWRTGHNEATEVKFYQDVYFGDQKVEAGTYVLYAIPTETEWELILNSDLDVWGAFQYNPEHDVARIKVPSKTAETLDVFSISFNKKNDLVLMNLGWDATRVAIPLKFKAQHYVAKR